MRNKKKLKNGKKADQKNQKKLSRKSRNQPPNVYRKKKHLIIY